MIFSKQAALRLTKPKQAFIFERLTERWGMDYAFKHLTRAKVTHSIDLSSTFNRRVAGVKNSLKVSGIDALATKPSNTVLKKQKALNRLSKAQRHKLNLIKQNFTRSVYDAYLSSFTAKEPISVPSLCRSFYKPYQPPKNKLQRLIESIYRVDQSKAPRTDDEHIGVEIECFIPHESLGDCGDDNEEYFRMFRSDLNECKLTNVQLKHDGSLTTSEDALPVELTVFFKKSDPTPLKRLCEVLKHYHAFVNKTCGLHVHLDQRGRARQTVTDRANRLDDVIFLLAQFMPKSRRNNSYCSLERGRVDGSRYHAVNRTAFKKFKTLEVRLHSGTTDFEKIINWVNLLVLIQSSSKLHKANGIDGLLSLMPEKLRSFYHKRYNLFKDNTIESEAA